MRLRNDVFYDRASAGGGLISPEVRSAKSFASFRSKCKQESSASDQDKVKECSAGGQDTAEMT